MIDGKMQGNSKTRKMILSVSISLTILILLLIGGYVLQTFFGEEKQTYDGVLVWKGIQKSAEQEPEAIAAVLEKSEAA